MTPTERYIYNQAHKERKEALKHIDKPPAKVLLIYRLVKDKYILQDTKAYVGLTDEQIALFKIKIKEMNQNDNPTRN